MKFKVQSHLPKSVKNIFIPYHSSAISAAFKEQAKEDYSLQLSDNLPGDTLQMVSSAGNGLRIILLDLKSAKDPMAIENQLLQVARSNPLAFQAPLLVDLRNQTDTLIGPTVKALQLCIYELGLYKTEETSPHPLSDGKAKVTLVVSEDERVWQKQVDTLQIITRHQMRAMDLVNAPGNKAHSAHFSQWIKTAAETFGFKARVLDRKQIEKKGLHAVLAVNRGSEWEPAFIIAEYQGSKDDQTKTLGLVGKGVTFDTGGLSIKGSQNMHYMKSDMGGAAAVLCTLSAIAELKWPVNIIAIAPITDNCVDANAIKPGDVIDSYSGKTIEVINTDAEGRLILADALAYMVQHFEIDHLIDLATLTGSCVRTFGTACAGLFCNDDELQDNLFMSGLETGEKCWSLPLWDEYGDEMKSDVADIKNLSSKPMAGAITAAKFLEYFTGEHPSWAHLDIAAMAFGDTRYGRDKAATGYGVHLLTHFVKEHLLKG